MSRERTKVNSNNKQSLRQLTRSCNSLARQGAGVGLRGAARNALSQIQPYPEDTRVFERANSGNAKFTAIQVDIAIYMSRSEDCDFHSTISAERKPAQSTKTRLERWQQHECQLPREFGVMKHAIGLELTMGRRKDEYYFTCVRVCVCVCGGGIEQDHADRRTPPLSWFNTGLVIFTPIEVAAFGLVATNTSKVNFGQLLQHYVQVRLGLDVNALPADFPEDDALLSEAKCFLCCTRTFALGREDSEENSERAATSSNTGYAKM